MKQVSDAGGRFPRCEDLLRLIDGSEREGSGSGPPIIEKISSADATRAGRVSRALLSGASLSKIESDLPTGSFKPRGALFALLTNAEQGTLAGVVAAVTGNHGAAVAYAARIVNLAATFLPGPSRGSARPAVDSTVVVL